MILSKAPVPHFYVTIEVEMGPVLDLRKDFAEKKPDQSHRHCAFDQGRGFGSCRNTRMSMFHVSRWAGSDRLRLHKAIHIGMAVGLEEGVIAPVIRDCRSERAWFRSPRRPRT
jgi:pyruvate dehydrogenase E2 component (dihydrolipoamide acetyltransferase)